MSQDSVVRRAAALSERPAVPQLLPSLALLIAVPLLALNLRPAVTSLGALLSEIRSDTGMSAALASAVVAAPVWCFAAGGGLAWAMRMRLGTGRTVTCALTALAVSLVARVISGPYLLLAGTIVACLAIAVLGTLLPAIVHGAPAKQWALLTGCYVAALGSGSAVGALVTPQIADHTSWKVGAGSWAVLACVGWLIWQVAARKVPERPASAATRGGPIVLTPAGTAWALTIHFGLTSGVTFTIMGWLPSMLLERSEVSPHTVGWLFAIAMALGVPFALLVPGWARRRPGQSGLAVIMALPTVVAIAGLFIAPALAPWVWAIGLGLGMPAVGLGLTAISLRADKQPDTAAALSSMVQGFGYAIAGTIALGTGLLHSYTQSWEWPLAALLVALCGQVGTGMLAGLPITVKSMRRGQPLGFPQSRRRGEPLVIPHPRRPA